VACRGCSRFGSGWRVALIALALVAGVVACTKGDDSASPGDGGDDSGEVVGAGDAYEATIRRTTDGVPHINGETFADAAFGQGYASGQDRTCDLIDQVLKVRGERANYLGPGEKDANINSDIAWRTIGMYDRAATDWESIPKQAKAIMTAFADGWNAQLKNTGVDRIAGWCRGADWVRPVEPVEVYAYSRSAMLLASGGFLAKYIASARPPGTEAPPMVSSGEPDAVAPHIAPNSTPAVPSSTVPSEAAAPTTAPPTTAAPAREQAMAAIGLPPVASNAWAVGSERTETGGGLLVGNPHFPWEGELRFWESHLTVPGEADIYGVQLSGLPGIGIGFTKDVGWSHTVSAGRRFTAYKLSLVPGSPTKYRYGDDVRDMTPTEHTIEVLGADGETFEVKRTTWSSHYGPIINFPGLGWTDAATITYRDANIDNDEFILQLLETMKLESLDQLKELNEKYNGVPLFNTIAASSDGRAWYADTAATPNLSKEAIAGYEASLETDPIVKIAADNGAVLLDGSNPLYEWVDAPGARDPGLVPYKAQPQVERDDYVFNANDSFWLPNAQHVLAGDYSPLHGPQDTARSPRTRENAVVLDDTSAEGPSGEDGKFTLDEIADASLLNVGFMARELRSAVVERCKTATSPVAVPEVAGADGTASIPAAAVDLVPACQVLADWDGRYDLDSSGAALWREFLSRYDPKQLLTAGALWAQPFDAARPVETPSGLTTAPAGAADPVLVNLATAVEVLKAAGYQPDVALGDIQFALRDGQRIPVHGGTGVDGVTNVVGWGTNTTSRDPALVEVKREKLYAGSDLAQLDGETGYAVNNGTSFLFAVQFGKGGPRAKAFLTYGNTEDRSADLYTAVTERLSAKKWRDVAFTESAVEDDQVGKTLTVKG